MGLERLGAILYGKERTYLSPSKRERGIVASFVSRRDLLEISPPRSISSDRLVR